MVYVCVICMVKSPPLSPMKAEYRTLLEAVVSPVINTEELKAFQWLLCTNCKPLLQAVHNFQQTALAGVKNLKQLLRKLNTAQSEGRKLRVVSIKLEPNVSTAAPKEREMKNKFLTAEAPTNVDPLTEELVLKSEPESDNEPELEPELEPDCDSESTMSCDSEINVQSNEKPTQQVQVIPKMGATTGNEGKSDVFTHKPQPSQKPVAYLSSIRWKDGVREGSKIQIRKKPSRVVCPHCGKSVLDICLRTHIIRVHGAWAKCKCDICGKLYPNPMSLKSHQRAHYKNTTIDDMRPELYCQLCAKPFPSPSLLRAHLTTLKHMSRDQYEFECETCKRRFADERRRQRHTDVVHLGLRKHKCDQCDKTYGDVSGLRQHVAIFHEKRAKLPKHVCHLCGKTFAVRKCMEEHLLTHEGLRPHKCPLCPATFTYKAALFTHNQLKHLNIKRKWKKKKKLEEKEEIPEEEKADSND